MREILKKISSLVANSETNEIVLRTTTFDFVKTRKAILRELLLSKDSKNVVGVYCKVFGEGMFLTAVEDIEYATQGEIIVFHPYDISGRALGKSRVPLSEIQMVCPFNKIYEKPVLANTTVYSVR